MPPDVIQSCPFSHLSLPFSSAIAFTAIWNTHPSISNAPSLH